MNKLEFKKVTVHLACKPVTFVERQIMLDGGWPKRPPIEYREFTREEIANGM